MDQIDRQLEAFIFAGGTHCPDYYKVHHSSIMVDSSSFCEIKIERVAHYLNVQRTINSQVKYKRKQQQYYFFIFFIKTSHQSTNKSVDIQDKDEFEDENPQIEIQQQLEIYL